MSILTDVFGNLANVTVPQIIMWAIGGLLIFLAIKKEMEPTLLLPMGFGAILVNLPIPDPAVTGEVTGVRAVIDFLFEIFTHGCCWSNLFLNHFSKLSKGIRLVFCYSYA